jgi:hypothetical protein
LSEANAASNFERMFGGTCCVKGCTREHLARGYCKLHYGRWKANGDPGPVDRLYERAKGLECQIDGCSNEVKCKGLLTSSHGRKPSLPVMPTSRLKCGEPRSPYKTLCYAPSAAHDEGRRSQASVAQRIEHRPPEPGAWVRVPPGAPDLAYQLTLHATYIYKGSGVATLLVASRA